MGLQKIFGGKKTKPVGVITQKAIFGLHIPLKHKEFYNVT
jgi:hypothetical protein